MGAVKKALADLPCVDPSTVQVDIKTKEARFKPNKDAKVDVDEVKKAVADAGHYTVTDVKAPKAVAAADKK